LLLRALQGRDATAATAQDEHGMTPTLHLPALPQGKEKEPLQHQVYIRVNVLST
jgi:hypothetical protein